jgi:hypothetical protein
MDVELTIEATARRRAALPYRLAELAGLALLLSGLAASAWWLALSGAGLIAVSYALYRRKYPDWPRRIGADGGSGSASDRCDDGDGGGGD